MSVVPIENKTVLDITKNTTVLDILDTSSVITSNDKTIIEVLDKQNTLELTNTGSNISIEKPENKIIVEVIKEGIQGPKGNSGNEDIEDLTDRVILLEEDTHTHDNKSLLDNTTANYTVEERNKLNNIESNAQVNPDSAGIKVLYESNNNTNAFTDTEKNKLSGIESGANKNQTDLEIKTQYENNPNTNVFTDADRVKLDGIEDGAKGDLTNTEVKALYESNTDTNVFTNIEKTKLAGIEEGAKKDQTALGVSYNNNDSTLVSTDTKSALDELANRTDNAGDGHSHSNKNILDNTTASYITSEKTKLGTVEFNAKDDQSANEVPYIGTLNATNVQDGLNELDTGVKTKVAWKNNWIPGLYSINDMVRDGEWTMVANKETTDRAAPQRVDDPFWVSSFDDLPPWPDTGNFNSTSVYSGQRYTWPQAAGYIDGLRVWFSDVSGNTAYTLLVIFNPLNEFPTVRSYLENFIPALTGWATIPVDPILVVDNTQIDIILIQTPTEVSTVLTGNWNYLQNNGNPTTGEARHDSNGINLRLHYVDSLGGNRESELRQLKAGSVIDTGEIRWDITNVTFNSTFADIEVSPQVRINNATYTFNFTTPTAKPITCVIDNDHYIDNPNVQGVHSQSGYDPVYLMYNNYIRTNEVIVPDNHAYGVDILLQEAYISPDWDLVATSQGLGNGALEGDVTTAELVIYDNTTSGLPAGNLQEATDQLAADKHNHSNKSILDNTTASYTTTEQSKLSGIDINANNYILPSDVVQDSTYVKTDNNYSNADKTKLDGLSEGGDGHTHNNLNVLDAVGSNTIINTGGGTWNGAHTWTGNHNFTAVIQENGTALSAKYEPVFTKNTAFNKNFGTTSGTVCQGNDSRLSNSRPPTSHNHAASETTSGTFAIARIPTGTSSTTVALGNHNHSGVYEPVFSKNNAFNKNFGTSSGTVCQGNDSRLSDARTPTAHTHPESEITDLGNYEPAFSKNTAFNKNFGTGSGTVCQGNDSRLSNARTPVTTGNYTWSGSNTFNGVVNIRAHLDLSDNQILRFGSGDDAEFFCNGSHFYLDLNSGIGNFYIRDGSTTRFTFDDAGHFTATGDIRTAAVPDADSDLCNKKYVDSVSGGTPKLAKFQSGVCPYADGYMFIGTDGVAYVSVLNDNNAYPGTNSTNNNIGLTNVAVGEPGTKAVDCGWIGNHVGYILTDSNELWTWGYQPNGQCGVGSTVNITKQTLASTSFTRIEAAMNIAYNGNNNYVCATTNGTLWYGWGYDWLNCMQGNQSSGSSVNRTTPIYINPPIARTIKRVWVGGADDHAMFCLASDGKFYFKGCNAYGSGGVDNGYVGSGDDPIRTWKVCVGLPTLSSTYYNNPYSETFDNYCQVVTAFGWDGNRKPSSWVRVGTSIYTCGNNEKGQLGHGDTTTRDAFTRITSISNAAKIVISGASATAVHCLTTSGAVISWGWGGYGQGGWGDETDKRSPVTTISSGVVDIWGGRGGDNHSESSGFFAKKSDGHIYATGNNNYGSLCLEPEWVQKLSSWTLTSWGRVGDIVEMIYCNSVDYSKDVSYAITSDGKLFVAGRLYSGPQCGFYGRSESLNNRCDIPVRLV